MPYPDVANPDLLERMPLDARVVLDVGCATGALGAEYKRRNPRARMRWWSLLSGTNFGPCRPPG